MYVDRFTEAVAPGVLPAQPRRPEKNRRISYPKHKSSSQTNPADRCATPSAPPRAPSPSPGPLRTPSSSSTEAHAASWRLRRTIASALLASHPPCLAKAYASALGIA